MDHEFFHTPTHPNGSAIVLTHGAGANCRAPLLVKVAETLSAEGILVLRTDMAFRRRRPFGPPSPHTSADDRAGLREAVSRLRALVTGPVYLGGHSYGGRQSSMLAAEEPGLVEGLLLFSYPLHPPNKPQQLRTAHFPALRTPAVFVHGTRDPFGTPEELRAAITQIPAKTHIIEVEGAAHDLKKGAFTMTQLAALIGSKG